MEGPTVSRLPRPSLVTVLLVLLAAATPAYGYVRAGWPGVAAALLGAVSMLALAALLALLVVRAARRRLAATFGAAQALDLALTEDDLP